MIQQSIVFYIRQSLDKHWMWTIYGQSLVLLLWEETILKALDKLRTYLLHGQNLDITCTWPISGQSLDSIICGSRPIAWPWPIGQIIDKHWTWTIARQMFGPCLGLGWALGGPQVGLEWAMIGPCLGHERAMGGPLVGHKWALGGL